MRTLSTGLLSAQQRAVASPHLKVVMDNALPGVVHPSFKKIYDGDESYSHVSIYMAPDGSLLRARLDRSEEKVYFQRVALPGDDSAYGSWTYMGRATREANVTLFGSSAQVFMVYVQHYNKREILYRESNNYGASWGSEKRLIYPDVTAVIWVCGAGTPTGYYRLFYVTDKQRLYSRLKSGRYWLYDGYWSHSVSKVHGVSAIYTKDWNLAVCGEDRSGAARVWTTVYGYGGELSYRQWSPLQTVTMAEAGSGVKFKYPWLVKADTFRLFFTETNSLTGSGYFKGLFWSYTPSADSFLTANWREPAPMNENPVYGVGLAGDSDNLWLSSSRKLWRAPLSSGGEVTADVVAAEVVESSRGGGATLTLRNDDGRYNKAGAGDAVRPARGLRVRIGPGYVTGQGPEASMGPAYWVEGIELRTGGGRAHVVLRLEDGWSLLRRWRARHQQNWDLGDSALEDILAHVLGAAGMDLSIISSSDTLKNLTPAFTILSNSNAESAVRRLLEMAPDTLFFRGAAPSLKLLKSAGAADYSYGEDHPIVQGRHLYRASRYNRVQVYGVDSVGEAMDWDQVDQVTDRLLQLSDINLTTNAQALARAKSLLAEEEASVISGTIETPVNCGLELYDVIEVTDPSAGLAAARRRVEGIRLRYRRGAGGPPLYTHTLTLSGA